MSKTTQQVTLDDVPIEYEVRESAEATQPRIDVGMHTITVVVPTETTVDPERLLEENTGWVLEKKAKFDEYRSQAPDRRFVAGEEFPYLGEPHEIVIETRSASVVADGALRLAEHHVEQTSVERALESLYQRNARELFEQHAEEYAAEMGVEYGEIQVRNQRTKWGSCSTSGTVSLNWRLIMSPDSIIEYVVIHELAHFIEPNHNDQFWAIVADYDPDYATHADWLEHNSSALIFSDADL